MGMRAQEDKYQQEVNPQEKVKKTMSILWYSLKKLSNENQELNYLRWFMENSDLKSASFYLKVRKMILLYVPEIRKTVSLLDSIRMKFGKHRPSRRTHPR